MLAAPQSGFSLTKRMAKCVQSYNNAKMLLLLNVTSFSSKSLTKAQFTEFQFQHRMSETFEWYSAFWNMSSCYEYCNILFWILNLSIYRQARPLECWSVSWMKCCYFKGLSGCKWKAGKRWKVMYMMEDERCRDRKKCRMNQAYVANVLNCTCSVKKFSFRKENIFFLIFFGNNINKPDIAACSFWDSALVPADNI